MIQLQRTVSSNPDFILLVRKLDAYLKIVDGDEHAFYNQYNNIENLQHVIVAYSDGVPVGCGAIKEYSESEVEIKRMFVEESQRGKRIAEKILHELELWGAELGFSKCILETGKKQTEAIRLYSRNNYTIIPNYGQYAEVENSICFEKSNSI